MSVSTVLLLDQSFTGRCRARPRTLAGNLSSARKENAMSKDDDSKQEAYNQEQKDAAAGTYKEPNGALRTMLDNTEERVAENEAYRKGHDHGESQKKS